VSFNIAGYKEIIVFISVSEEESQSKTVDEQTKQPGTHNTSRSDVASLKIEQAVLS